MIMYVRVYDEMRCFNRNMLWFVMVDMHDRCMLGLVDMHDRCMLG